MSSTTLHSHHHSSLPSLPIIAPSSPIAIHHFSPPSIHHLHHSYVPHISNHSPLITTSPTSHTFTTHHPIITHRHESLYITIHHPNHHSTQFIISSPPQYPSSPSLPIITHLHYYHYHYPSLPITTSLSQGRVHELTNVTVKSWCSVVYSTLLYTSAKRQGQ